MQIAIPLIESIYDNIELRYCLRSIETHLTGVTGITIIGHKPGWLHDVQHIPFPAATTHEWKEKNIYDKLCQMKGRFLYMNDDHFLLTEYNARKFPYYYEGTLADRLQKCSNRHVYAQTVRNTRLLVNGDWEFFDIHCPIILDSNRMHSVNDWSKPFGYCMKTLYASWKQPISYPDLKLNAFFDANQIRSLISGRQWFSTSESAWNEPMFEVMEELYPIPSAYE